MLNKERKENDEETYLQTLTKMGIKHGEADYIFVPGRLHGQIKVHKNIPAYRPIIDMSTKIGKPIEKWILNKIKLLYFGMKKYNILKTSEMIELIEEVYNKKKVNKNDKIISMDFSSMYTNVPVDEAMKIIKILWRNNTTLMNEINEHLATKIIGFYTTVNTIFVSEDRWFKQAKGLMMGAALSPIVAAILLDYKLQRITESTIFCEEYILMIYADDMLFIGNPTDLGKISQKLDEDLPSMPYTIDNEEFCNLREDYNLEYLDTSVRRKQTYDAENGILKNTITYAWKKKKYDSYRTLNFYSDHDESTKRNTITSNLCKAVYVTHYTHIKETLALWRNILLINNFPEHYILHEAIRLIIQKLNKYKILRPSEKTEYEKEINRKWYMALDIIKMMADRKNIVLNKIIPYVEEDDLNDDLTVFTNQNECNKSILNNVYDEDIVEKCGMNYAMFPITPFLTDIKRITKILIPGIKIAMQPLNKNEKHIFTVIKDKLDGNYQTNKIIKWKCAYCNIWFAIKIYLSTVEHIINNMLEYKHNFIYMHYTDVHKCLPIKPDKWTTLSKLLDNTDDRLENRLAIELTMDNNLYAATQFDNNKIHKLIRENIKTLENN